MNRNQEAVKAINELFHRSRNYRRSKDYLELLRFLRRFPLLSPYNAFLIHTQYPGAVYVATAEDWDKKFDRKVNEDARPLVILIPFGPVSFVYEVQETAGVDLPPDVSSPFRTEGGYSEKMYDFTVRNMARDGIQARYAPFGNQRAGYASLRGSEFSVCLNSNLTRPDLYSSLLHELGHIYCGHLGSGDDKWWDDRKGESDRVKELEAESVSFLVCSRQGLKTNSEPYLERYVAVHDLIDQINFRAVLTVTNYLEQMGRRILPPRKRGEVRERKLYSLKGDSVPA